MDQLLATIKGVNPKAKKFGVLGVILLTVIFMFALPVTRISVTTNNQKESASFRFNQLGGDSDSPELKGLDEKVQAASEAQQESEASQAPASLEDAQNKAEEGVTFMKKMIGLFIMLIVDIIFPLLLIIIGLFRKRIGVIIPGLLFVLTLVTLFMGTSFGNPNIVEIGISAGAAVIVNMIIYILLTAFCYLDRRAQSIE